MSAMNLIGRTVDSKYCQSCGIKNGIFIMSLDKSEYLCPTCKKPMTNQVFITIQK
jgi:hypothetical protein